MPERYHEDVRSSSLRIEIGSRAPDGSGVEGDGEREGCVVDDVESIVDTDGHGESGRFVTITNIFVTQI